MNLDVGLQSSLAIYYIIFNIFGDFEKALHVELKQTGTS